MADLAADEVRHPAVIFLIRIGATTMVDAPSPALEESLRPLAPRGATGCGPLLVGDFNLNVAKVS